MERPAMTNLGVFAHEAPQARWSGPARLHPSGLLVVLGTMVFAATVLAAGSFSGVRAHPAYDDQTPTRDGAVGAVRTSAVPVTGVAVTASGPGSGRPAGTQHRPARAVLAELGSLEPDLALLSSWTVAYVVGPENGDGANIEIPLRHLDGLVIKPGSTFEFWRAVGEVSRRTGYRRGAVIVGNHIDPDGALAGGICTVSTALFEAAARAGLPIVRRTSHGGYLEKYELGLDAAVAKGDGFSETLAFRNDTGEPIFVRTISSPGVARVDLYAKIALGRRVTISQPAISHRQHAGDRHVQSASLPRGQHRRVEPASEGMRVVVTRTVRDAAGHVLQRDRWVSTYRRLVGVVLVGIA
jgi:VanW like protein